MIATLQQGNEISALIHIAINGNVATTSQQDQNLGQNTSRPLKYKRKREPKISPFLGVFSSRSGHLVIMDITQLLRVV